MHQLRRGRGGAVVLSGEPGIGKTALLGHVAAMATDATVVTARGLLSEASLSFAGLGDLIRPLLPGLGALPKPQAAALSTALALAPPSGPVSGYAVCLATLNLLAVSAEQRPVMVVVDDAHWLDAPSATALLFAARRMGADPVAVVFAIRSGESMDFDTRGLPVLELTGLDRADSARLLETMRPGQVAAEVAEELWRATGGNPLALKEVAGRLDDRQLSGRVPLEDPLPMGRDLVAAFARRVDPLPEETRTALLVLALSASSEAHDLAAALRFVGSDLSVLEPAEAAGLIGYEAAQLMFTHPLIRAAVHDGATTLARRRAYEALAATATGEARAWYRAAGVAGTDEDVAAELESAAAEMRRRTGWVTASQALRRAAELTGDRELRARRLLAAGVDAQLAGRLQVAAAWLDEARTLATDPLLVADIDLRRGRVLTWRGTPAVAQQVLAGAATAVAGLDRLRAAWLWSEAILPGLMEGRVNDAVDYGRRADDLLGNVHDTDAVAEARTLLAQGLILTGKVGEARHLMDALTPYMDALDPVAGQQAIVIMAQCRAWIEDYGMARSMLDRVIEATRRSAAPGTLAFALVSHSELDRWTGNWVAAYADADEALCLAREMQDVASISYALTCLARIEATQGRGEPLQQHLAEARRLSDTLGIGCMTLYEGAARGLAHLATGAPDAAIACLEPVREFCHRNGIASTNDVPWEADLIEAYCRAGRVADAESQLTELDKKAQTTGLVWPRTAAARCRGLLAEDGDTAEACFREAMKLHEQVPQPFEHARTALSFGEMLRRGRRRAEARHMLRESLHTFQRLGAEPFARRAAAELAATGEHPRGRHDWSALQQLTAQELQVALAVARGLSNPEIAAALFISRKTVEAHLSSAYRKLGLRSRTQLVRHLARAEAVPAENQIRGDGSGNRRAMTGSA